MEMQKWDFLTVYEHFFERENRVLPRLYASLGYAKALAFT